MQSFEGKQEGLIVNPFTHRQPMQAPEDWCNMLVFATCVDQPDMQQCSELAASNGLGHQEDREAARCTSPTAR